LKKGDKSDPGNYRPVSLTSVTAQVTQLSLTNPRDALHRDKRKNAKTVTSP